MSRLNALLLLILIGSALVLVHSSYQTRRLFADLERAKGEERQLKGDTVRMQAEARHEATHLKVESTARARLGMNFATAADILFVADSFGPAPGRAVAAPGAASASASAAEGALP